MKFCESCKNNHSPLCTDCIGALLKDGEIIDFPSNYQAKVEHDRCVNCAYEDKDYNEYPCSDCRSSVTTTNYKYNDMPDMWSEKPIDNVNHPIHYNQDGSMECIDEMIELFGKRAVADFCLCNVWKYRKRAIYKNGEEDMKKSDWYLKKFFELRGMVIVDVEET